MDKKGLTFKFVFSSDINLMHLVIETIENILQELGLDTERNWKILLALREIVTNSVIHGNKRDPAKKVEVTVNFGDEIEFIVKDQGRAFDFKSLSSIPHDPLAPNGRGLYLAHQIMDEVIYEFHKGNVIKMKKRL